MLINTRGNIGKRPYKVVRIIGCIIYSLNNLAIFPNNLNNLIPKLYWVLHIKKKNLLKFLLLIM